MVEPPTSGLVEALSPPPDNCTLPLVEKVRESIFLYSTPRHGPGAVKMHGALLPSPLPPTTCLEEIRRESAQQRGVGQRPSPAGKQPAVGGTSGWSRADAPSLRFPAQC
jgi:hypothetical protein